MCIGVVELLLRLQFEDGLCQLRIDVTHQLLDKQASIVVDYIAVDHQQLYWQRASHHSQPLLGIFDDVIHYLCEMSELYADRKVTIMPTNRWPKSLYHDFVP